MGRGLGFGTVIAVALSPVSLVGPALATLITPLTPLSGDTGSIADKINDSGVIAGASTIQSNDPFPSTLFHATRWIAPSTPQSLGGSQTRSIAYSINATGEIAGESNDAFRWTDPGPMQDIGELFTQGATATSVNSSGVIVGGSETGTTYHAFLYSGSGPMQDMGFPTNGTQAYANDINDAGTIVGWYITTGTTKRGFYNLAGGSMTAMPGALPEARAINSSGVIVGNTVGTNGCYRTTIGGTTSFLTNFGLSGDSVDDINDAGDAVGTMIGRDPGVNNHALLWKPDNSVVDLDTWLDQTSPSEGALWTIQFAEGINQLGQVVGYGNYNDGVGGLPDGQMGFVLDASSLIPEPSPFFLLPPMVTFLILRRRNKTASAW